MAKKETPTTTLSDLPEPPIDAVFDRLPLRKLLRIDEVCHAWKKLKPFALRRRRHLIIANGKGNLELLLPDLKSEHYLLKFVLENLKEKEEDGYGKPYSTLLERLDRHAFFIGRNQPLPSATLDRLMELLPNLKVFQLVHRHGSHLELVKVAQLLDHYREQLEQVTIWFWGVRGNQSQEEIQPHSFKQAFTLLMDSLNRMTKLRSLLFDFQTAPGWPVIIDDDQLVQHSLPDLVCRLKTLTFRTRLDMSCSNPDARLLTQVLIGMRDGVGADKSVTPSPKKEMNLELCFPYVSLSLRTIISLGPGPVAAGLRSVWICDVTSNVIYESLAQMARQSPHLQSLTVKLKTLSLRRLVESLVSLQELVHLHIGYAPGNPSQDEEGNVRQLPVLPSLKSLRLEFPSLSHRNYEQLYLETFFPNLQRVVWIFIGWSCTDCGYMIPWGQVDGTQFKADYGTQMSDCLRLARLAAFSRLPRLSKLWVKVCPYGIQLPFKEQLFTSLQSLSRRTEFVDKNDGEKIDKHNCVFYD